MLCSSHLHREQQIGVFHLGQGTDLDTGEEELWSGTTARLSCVTVTLCGVMVTLLWGSETVWCDSDTVW